MEWLGILFIVGIVLFAMYKANTSPSAVAARDADREAQRKIVCPHCHEAGGVTRQRVVQKKGISGGKATGAIMTGGASLFATGLSRKENATQMSCSNCGTQWFV